MKERAAEPLTEPSSRQLSAKRKRTNRPPLWWRITYDEHMVALVRLLGTEGLAVKDVSEKAKSLLEKFGRERTQVAADEITECVGEGDAAVVRLTELARKLAVHLFGPVQPAVLKPTNSGVATAPSSTPTPRGDQTGNAGAHMRAERGDRSGSDAAEPGMPAAAASA